MNHKTHPKAKLFLLFLLLNIGIIFSSDKILAATHSLTVNNNETAYANVNAKNLVASKKKGAQKKDQ